MPIFIRLYLVFNITLALTLSVMLKECYELLLCEIPGWSRHVFLSKSTKFESTDFASVMIAADVISVPSVPLATRQKRTCIMTYSQHCALNHLISQNTNSVIGLMFSQLKETDVVYHLCTNAFAYSYWKITKKTIPVISELVWKIAVMT